jgi:PKD repeat protein
VALAAGVGLVGCSSDGTATDASSTGGSPTTSTTAAAPLVASFEIDLDLDTTRPTSCPLQAITFTDTSQGQPTQWAWAFPDGSTSDERSPVVTPTADNRSDWDGEVSLTVTRGDQSDTATDDIVVPTC